MHPSKTQPKGILSVQREVHWEAIADLDGLAALLSWDEFREGVHHSNGLLVQQRVDASKDGDIDHRTVGVDDEFHEYFASQTFFRAFLGYLVSATTCLASCS